MKATTYKEDFEVLGIKFFECVTDNIDTMSNILLKMGFQIFAKHKKESMLIFCQNKIYCIVHEARKGYARDFFMAHGPSICSIGFDISGRPENIINYAKNLGYQIISADRSTIPGLSGIIGVGKSIIYLASEDKLLEDFLVLPQIVEQTKEPKSQLMTIDHVAMNVFPGQTKEWSTFYNKIFGFHELNEFEIEGQYTSLHTYSMGNTSGSVKLVISESADNVSQITEFLDRHNGAGVQHIAFGTKDIYSSVNVIKKNGIAFMSIPSNYYQKIDKRLPHHQENIKDLQSNHILIDGDGGDNPNILLQIFTKCLFGPIFFEVIQRKGNHGFGAGNIKALFESVEQDQIARNVLKVKQRVAQND